MNQIAEQVFAAFQVEYQEHLEGIRALLSRIEEGRPGDERSCIDQAFRLAHSLKGGARVCDLRPVEELGHRLEAVFERVRGGGLRMNEEVVTTIKLVLDAVEDWMSARERDDNPAPPQAALAALEGVLEDRPAVASARAGSQPEPIARRLLSAFLREYPKYLSGLEQLIAPSNAVASADDWEEGYRLAHNLRASADAAEIRSLVAACGDLESLLRGIRQCDAAPDPATRERLQACWTTVRRELQSLDAPGAQAAVDCDAGTAGEPGAAEGGGEPATSASRSSGTASVFRAADTVRIATAGLDALSSSSRQLLTESLGQDQIGCELDELRRQIVEMRRDHELFRHVAAASLRRLETMPECGRVARYFENVDRDFRVLERRSRQVCGRHKRTTRSLQSAARRIEHDVGRTRMVAAETVYQGFRKMVRDLAREAGKQIEFRAVGLDVRADRTVFQSLKDPLIHMLRNCVVHGVEAPERRREVGKDPLGRIDLRIETVGNRLTVEVDDDGRGLDRERIFRRAVERGRLSANDRLAPSAEELDGLIYEPGFSTSERLTEVAGRGMGLSVVRETVTRLQGDVQIGRKDSAGTLFRITVPLTVSTHRLLLVSLDDRTYAIPVHAVERVLRIPVTECETIEGKPVVTLHDRPIALVDLGDLLEAPRSRSDDEGEMLRVVVIKAGSRRMAVRVDGFLSERNLLMQDLDVYAASNRYLGAVLPEDGVAALVLNPAELLDGARPGARRTVVEQVRTRRAKATPRVLVVDDSFTTRTLEKSILEANGFQVGIAVDGREGLSQLQRERFDLVISDVEMPRMDGFALLAAIKQDERLSSTPVVLVTSRDRREDREKGLDLGADAYIVKQKFDHQSWLSTIREIVGA